MRLAPAVLTLICVAAGSQSARAQAPTRTIQGTVRDSASGETLPYASVSIVELRIATQTNTDGRFVLFGVPAGSHVLRVRFLGYRPADISFDPAQVSAPLSIRLARAPLEMAGVTVTATDDQHMDVTQGVGVIALSPAQIAVMPSLGEQDIFRALQMMPGVSGTNDGSADLSVRGGTPDQNLVLLDGMTVYHVDHFFGLFSAFNADAIKSVRLYVGGYPAQYGGRVSSVLDLTGKTGDAAHFRMTAGANLLSARGVAEIPLGQGSLLLSGRRSYTDLIQSPLYSKLFGFASGTSTTTAVATPPGGFGGGPGRFTQTTVQPSFYFDDLNAKLTYRPSAGDLVQFSGYQGGDHLDQSVTIPAFGGVGASGETTDVTTWGNRAASGHWFRQWGGRLSTDLLVAGSRYTSDGSRSVNATSGTGTPNFGLGFNESNVVDDYTLRLDNTVQLAQALQIGFGTWITQNQVTYDFALPLRDSADTPRGLHRAADGRQASVYAQQTWTALGRLQLTTGVRATNYDLTQTTYVEPRASLSLALTPELKIKGAWGQYHQFVDRVENEDVLQGSRDFWLLADTSLRATAATHSIIGASYERGPWVFEVEAYNKDYHDLSIFSRRYRQGLIVDYGSLFYTGDGVARGIDFVAQRKFGRLTGWVSYTLGQVTDSFPGVDGGRPFPANQDQRHQLKTAAILVLGGWTMSATWIYGSGTPYTAPLSEYQIPLLDGTLQQYIHVSDKNALRLPAYHRLDMGAFHRFETDGPWDVELGLSLFNVYNRQNVWYRQFNLTTNPISVTDVHLLGFTPSLDLKVTLK
jgi:hypothetical protein